VAVQEVEQLGQAGLIFCGKGGSGLLPRNRVPSAWVSFSGPDSSNSASWSNWAASVLAWTVAGSDVPSALGVVRALSWACRARISSSEPNKSCERPMLMRSPGLRRRICTMVLLTRVPLVLSRSVRMISPLSNWTLA
jgi:hypothetical protein